MDLPKYGEVKYDYRGYPICHICGKSFKKLLSHVWQKHGLTAYEYKKQFGLDTTKGIIYEGTRKKLQKSVSRHYNLVVIKNLIKGGEKTRFKEGSKGRTKDQVSEQTRKMLSDHIKKLRKPKKK